MSELTLSKRGGRDALPYVVVKPSDPDKEKTIYGGYTSGKTGYMRISGKIVKPSESGYHALSIRHNTGYSVGKNNESLESVNAVGSCLFMVNSSVGEHSIDMGMDDLILYCPYIGSSASITVPVSVKKSGTKILEGNLTLIALYGSYSAVCKEGNEIMSELGGSTSSFPKDSTNVSSTERAVICTFDGIFLSGYNTSPNIEFSIYVEETCGSAIISGGHDVYNTIDDPFEYQEP